MKRQDLSLDLNVSRVLDLNASRVFASLMS